MKTLTIKRKVFNLDALKGISRNKFIKSGHGSSDEFDVLEPFVKVRVSKKKEVKKEEGGK